MHTTAAAKFKRITARLLILALGTTIAASAEENERLNHYVQVDLGTKRYDIDLYRDAGPDHLHGEFTTSLVVTPTVRFRGMDKNGNLGWLVTGGIAYGHFSDDLISADTLEWQLGLGGIAMLTSWANLSVMCSAGSGWTWVDLPNSHQTWDSQTTALGVSGHVEAVAVLGIELKDVLLTATAGYRYLGMTISNPEERDQYDDYRIQGFVVGVGVGFTF